MIRLECCLLQAPRLLFDLNLPSHRNTSLRWSHDNHSRADLPYACLIGLKRLVKDQPGLQVSSDVEAEADPESPMLAQFDIFLSSVMQSPKTEQMKGLAYRNRCQSIAHWCVSYEFIPDMNRHKRWWTFWKFQMFLRCIYFSDFWERLGEKLKKYLYFWAFGHYFMKIAWFLYFFNTFTKVPKSVPSLELFMNFFSEST